jgi:hypothetical protein
MKKNLKKLTLNKETVRLLGDKSISDIRGGLVTTYPDSAICGYTQLPCTWTCGA